MSDKKMEDIFDEEFGDLLDGVERKPESVPTTPTTPVETAPTAPAVAKPTAPAPAKAKPADNVGGFVTFGTKVSSVPIPRFKASKDNKARFAILSQQVLPVKTHYVDDIGNIICFDGKCCEFEGLPRVRYLVPIVVYATNKNGGIIGQDIELQVLTLGAEQYGALADAVEFSGRALQDVDIVCTCTDDQYQKLTFAADASKGAQWKGFPGAKEIVDLYKKNKDKLYMAVARQISEETYLTRKGYMHPQVATNSVANVSNVDDLLDD